MKVMKPKVFIFTTSYHPFIGGAEIAIADITRRLKDRFDFYIVTARMRRGLPSLERRPEGTVIRLGLGTGLDKWLLPLLVCTKLNLMHQARPGAVIVGVDISQGAVAAAFYKFLYPSSHFIFNIQYGYGEERISRGRLGAIGLAFRFILLRADYVTAISNYLLDLTRKYGYQGPAEVVHNGVDLEKFKTQSKRRKTITHNQKVIITTSRLVPKNGIDTLLQALAEVKKTIPDIRCHIIGDGPELERLGLQAVSYKLQANVKFLGSIPHQEIPRHLRGAHVFVRPSRSEGMGNSFVEALAAGLPIIGTPVGGITDIIRNGETGLFCRVDDPQDVAEKIKLIIADEKTSRALVEAGRHMVEERFSWDKIADRYGKIFSRQTRLKSLKILIATPLFPPQIGGPALYAQSLGEEFRKMGHHISVISFGQFLHFPSGVRHFLYLLSFFFHALKSDIIFALDYFSVGTSAAITAMILQKPLVIRLEGDFLWEKFVERTRSDVTLSRFYSQPPALSLKERIIRLLTQGVVRNASRVVFSSSWRKRMVMDVHRIAQEKTAVIRNVWPSFPDLVWEDSQTKSGKTKGKKVILWAGRMLYLKNLHRLIMAFDKANDGSYALHLVGEGTEKQKLEDLVKRENIRDVKFFSSLPREDLLHKYKESAFLVLPSLSDVGPNVIADAVSMKTPFIITSDSGYTENLAGYGLVINPCSEEDIVEKLKMLMRDEIREKYCRLLRYHPRERSWSQAAKDWINIFYESLGYRA